MTPSRPDDRQVLLELVRAPHKRDVRSIWLHRLQGSNIRLDQLETLWSILRELGMALADDTDERWEVMTELEAQLRPAPPSSEDAAARTVAGDIAPAPALPFQDRTLPPPQPSPLLDPHPEVGRTAPTPRADVDRPAADGRDPALDLPDFATLVVKLERHPHRRAEVLAEHKPPLDEESYHAWSAWLHRAMANNQPLRSLFNHLVERQRNR